MLVCYTFRLKKKKNHYSIVFTDFLFVNYKYIIEYCNNVVSSLLLTCMYIGINYNYLKFIKKQ